MQPEPIVDRLLYMTVAISIRSMSDIDPKIPKRSDVFDTFLLLKVLESKTPADSLASDITSARSMISSVLCGGRFIVVISILPIKE